MRPGSLGRHRLSGRFRPKFLPVRPRGPRAGSCASPASAYFPLHEGPMRGLAARFGVDHAPWRRLQRPRRAPVVPAAGAKTPQRTCLRAARATIATKIVPKRNEVLDMKPIATTTLALGALIAFGPSTLVAETKAASAVNTHLHYLDQKSVSFSWDKAGGGAIEPLGDDLLIVTPWGRIVLARSNGSVASLEGRIPMELGRMLSYPIRPNERPHSFTFRVADILLKPRSGKSWELFVTHHYFTGRCIYFRLSSTMVFREGESVLVSPSWRTVFDAVPCLPNRGGLFHEQAGGRLLTDGPDHLLVVTGGHGNDGLVQDPESHMGKLVRIEIESGEAEVLALGLRNPQGFARDADGVLWGTEHGPQGGDELNVLEPGANYGWPLVTFGVQYGGTAYPGIELNESGKHPGYIRSTVSLFSWLRSLISGTSEIARPVFAWVPSIGISAMIVNDERQFPLWKDDLIVSSLRNRSIFRIRRLGKNIQHVEPIPLGYRVRDMTRMPDGRIALLADDKEGREGRVYFLSLSSEFCNEEARQARRVYTVGCPPSGGRG